MKKNKMTVQKESWYIFFIVLLACMFLLSLGLFIYNPLTQNLPESTGLKPLGTKINMSLESNNSLSQTLYFYGSLLPNSKTNQEVFVTLKPTQENCLLRARVYMYSEENKLINMQVETTSEWQTLEDGYSYYNGTFSPNLTLQFLKSITTPPSDEYLSSNNLYIIIISFETMPTTADYNKIWKLN